MLMMLVFALCLIVDFTVLSVISLNLLVHVYHMILLITTLLSMINIFIFACMICIVCLCHINKCNPWTVSYTQHVWSRAALCTQVTDCELHWVGHYYLVCIYMSDHGLHSMLKCLFMNYTVCFKSYKCIYTGTGHDHALAAYMKVWVILSFNQ